MRQSKDNPIADFQVDRASIQYVGENLQRPECVLAERNGTLWAADARGGVLRINPDGSQELVRKDLDTRFADSGEFGRAFLRGTLPNGMVFDRKGDLIIANFGTGTIDFLTRAGAFKTLYTEIDGEPLGIVNFVIRDSKDRIWFTVTTKSEPLKGLNGAPGDGYIGVIDEHGIRKVADGIAGTNEIRFDDKEEYLYVVESFACRITRFKAHPDARLTDYEVYGPSDVGLIPDGCAFDAFGNLWVACVFSDRIIAITADGDLLTLFDDGDEAALKRLEQHFRSHTVTPEIMGAAHGTIAPVLGSITFGGPDLRTVYLGSILGKRLPYFRSPVAGLPLTHWNERYG